jgi:hypothetical protein
LESLIWWRQRSRRAQLSPTEAGRAYLAASRGIVYEIDDAERAAADEYRAPRGHLPSQLPSCWGGCMYAGALRLCQPIVAPLQLQAFLDFAAPVLRRSF